MPVLDRYGYPRPGIISSANAQFLLFGGLIFASLFGRMFLQVG